MTKWSTLWSESDQKVDHLVNFDVTTDLAISLCQTENAASHWLLEIHNKMAAPFQNSNSQTLNDKIVCQFERFV